MANPYKSAGSSTAKSKFKAMLGKSDGAKRMNEAVPYRPSAVKNGVDDVKVMGNPGSKRLDRYARGGKVKKGGTTVNVIVPSHAGGGPAGPGAAPPMPMPPPMPPPGMGGKPPMPMPPPPGGMGMPTPPPGMGAMPLPGMPMRKRGGSVKSTKCAPTIGPDSDNAYDDTVQERASGGYIGGEPKSSKLKQWAKYSSKNSYHKKLGGGIGNNNSGKYPINAGADSGLGRLQLSKDQAKKQTKIKEAK